MKENKEAKLSYWARHLTTIISVTLVLLLVGIIAMISVGASGETRRLKERVELSVIMADSISDAQAAELLKTIRTKPYVNSAELITRQQALDNWMEETGENLEELFGVNPLSPEIAFTVKAEYASNKSIAGIVASLSKLPEVESVAAPDSEALDAMNSNIATLTLTLSIIAAAMLLISFVLINNTVHLTIYSRRFTIHTMQLVGATKAFIKRPVILSNFCSGMIAGAAASAFLALALYFSPRAGIADLSNLITWEVMAIIAGGLILSGGLLCALAAWIASSRFLRKDYDRLFR